MYLNVMLKKVITIFSILFVLSSTSQTAYAQDCEAISCDNESAEYFECIKEKQSCIEDKLTEIETEQITLGNTISVINGKINIQELSIQQTLAEISKLEKEILNLDNRIDGLSISLDRLSTLLIGRIRAQYKQSQVNSVTSLFASKSISNFVNQYRYLSLAGNQTADAMQRAENQRTIYDEQKDIKEIKQDEVEQKRTQLQNEQNNLVGQRQEQQHFLNITKNDEKKFQDMLASVRAEFEAIQAIISTRGNDVLVGDVSAGDNIASIIQGSSCNSGGSHLHFTMVNSNNETLNPFNYLKGIDHNNCSGPGSCSSGDNFNPSGNWEWPIKPTIKYSQGYGSTWAVRNTWVGQIYSFHNGIDINSTTSSSINAVADGTLYRGSYTGSGGCRLRYVRIDHNNDGLSSLYLHVNY